MPILAAIIAKLALFLEGATWARVTARWFWLSMLSTIVGGAFVLTVAVFNGYLAPLAQQAFNTQYGQFMGLAFPPVAGTCMATLSAALLASFLWKLKRHWIDIMKGGGN